MGPKFFAGGARRSRLNSFFSNLVLLQHLQHLGHFNFGTRVKFAQNWKAFGLALALLCPAVASSAGEDFKQVFVFTSGTAGYHTFRIPAIVRATNGVLLAFAEGRRKSASDSGDIDLVLKRSLDGGLTWGALQIVGDGGTNTIGNPVPIVDTVTGRIILLTTHNRGSVTEAQVMSGEVVDRRVFVQDSGDNGATWTAAREITSDAKRGNWRGYATGPGHGIQLEHGPCAGRLVAACDHTTSHSSGWDACGAHLLLSDDHGATWRIGADNSPNDGLINPNESTLVELRDGKILVITRNQNGRAAGHRAAAWSGDGGETFDAPFKIQVDLISPVVEGSLLRFPGAELAHGGDWILFSAPADPSRRRTMTIRSSVDGARSWGRTKMIYNGPAAYSDMVALPGGKAGLLYEAGVKNPYEEIRFTVVSGDFLASPDTESPVETGSANGPKK